MELAAAKAAGATSAQIAALYTMTNGEPIPDAVVNASPDFPRNSVAATDFEPLVILNGAGLLADVTTIRVAPGGDLTTSIAAAYECCVTPVCYDGVRIVHTFAVHGFSYLPFLLNIVHVCDSHFPLFVT